MHERGAAGSAKVPQGQAVHLDGVAVEVGDRGRGHVRELAREVGKLAIKVQLGALIPIVVGRNGDMGERRECPKTCSLGLIFYGRELK